MSDIQEKEQMSDIQKAVREILQHRRENLRPAEAALSKVDDLLNALKVFQGAAAEAAGLLPEKAVGGIKAFPAGAAIKSARDARETLERAMQRLRRDCVNIGVAGRARQGKSTFLRTFSGLADDAIPTGKGGFCTAARSEIRNSAAPGARVLLHTRDSFLKETVLPYYDELGLSPVPNNLDEFLSRKLPPLKNAEDVLRSNRYKVLEDMRANLSKVMGMMLGGEKTITPGEVRAYVTKDKGDWNYLAVRKAVIDAKFPHPGLPLELRLIDLPGLGELALNIEQELTKSVADLADIVLIIRKPNPSGDAFGDNDVTTFNLVRKALPDLEPDRWMAMIINHSVAEGDDSTAIAYEMATEMAPKFEFGGIKIWLCDCSNADEVRTKVIGPAMILLKDNTKWLDKKRLDAARESLEKVNNLLAASIQTLKATLADHGPDFPDGIAETNSEDFITELHAKLRIFLNNLRPGTTKDGVNLANDIVQEVNRILTDFHPVVEGADHPAGYRPWDAATISKKLKIHQGGFDGVRNESATNTRVALTRFISSRLEPCFHTYSDNLKRRFADEIKSIDPMSKFIALVDDQKKDAGLGAMADAVDGQAPTLSKAFRRFSQLSFTYDANFHPIVRSYLRPLDPDDKKVFESSDGLGQLHSVQPNSLEFDADAKHIRGALDLAAERILDRLSKEPQKLSGHLEQAIFAAAEELFDQILWSEEAEREWKRVLRNWRRELWADQYSKQDDRDKAVGVWRRRLGDIERSASELAAATLRPE